VTPNQVAMNQQNKSLVWSFWEALDGAAGADADRVGGICVARRLSSSAANQTDAVTAMHRSTDTGG